MVDASRESHSKLFGGVILQEMLEKTLVSHLAFASLTLFATVFSVMYFSDVFFCVYWEIQKLFAFLVVFLGAYLCQILKEMNMNSLVSFACLVHLNISI